MKHAIAPIHQWIRHWNRHGIFFLVIVNSLFTISLTSCDLKKIDPSILKIDNGSDPQSLDLHKSTDMPGLRVISSLFEGLVIRADSSRVKPGVAKEWTISEDGRTYTFTLRTSRWSDGTPLTAHDFAYSWKRLVDPRTAAQYANLLSAVMNADSIMSGTLPPDSLGVLALNDTTFIVHLTHPQPYFLNLCSFEPFFPVKKEIVEKYGKQWISSKHMVSNGPFQLTDIRFKQYIEVKRNPLYWDAESVSLQSIRFYSVENSNTAVAMFKSGELDWVFTVPPTKISKWKDSPEFTTLPQFGLYFYRLNLTHPALKNRKIRQALSYSIDREILTNFVTKGGQLPADSYIPQGISWYSPKKTTLYNPDKAKKLFKESGYSAETFPPLEILYNTSESHKVIAEAISKMWENTLGIKVELRNYEWKVLLDALNNYEYSIARGSWVGDYIDPSTFTDIFTSTNGNNRTGFSSTLYDSLAERSAYATNEKERAELFHQMEEIILEELPVIPIYFYRNIELRSPRISNITNNLLGLYTFKEISLQTQ